MFVGIGSANSFFSSCFLLHASCPLLTVIPIDGIIMTRSVTTNCRKSPMTATVKGDERCSVFCFTWARSM